MSLFSTCWIPSFAELLDGADIDDAIVEMVNQTRHALAQKLTIHVHRVAAQRSPLGLGVLLQKCQHLKTTERVGPNNSKQHSKKTDSGRGMKSSG
jgi:hypothetical protein